MTGNRRVSLPFLHVCFPLLWSTGAKLSFTWERQRRWPHRTAHQSLRTQFLATAWALTPPGSPRLLPEGCFMNAWWQKINMRTKTKTVAHNSSLGSHNSSQVTYLEMRIFHRQVTLIRRDLYMSQDSLPVRLCFSLQCSGLSRTTLPVSSPSMLSC